MDIYRREAAVAAQYLRDALKAPVEKHDAHLVQLLHENGLNVPSLGLIAQSTLAAAKEDFDATSEMMLQLIAVEILARAVRRSMFLSMTREGRARSLTTANDYLQRAACSLLRTSKACFEKGLLPLLRRMFSLETIDTEPNVQLLKRTLQRRVVIVTKSLCELCGLRVVRGNVAEIVCQTSHHSYSSFHSPEHETLIAALAQDASEQAPAFGAAYRLPLRIRFSCRGGRLADAWREATQLVELRIRNMSERFLNAEAWTTGALIVAQCGRSEDSATSSSTPLASSSTSPHFFSYRLRLTCKCRPACTSSRVRCTPNLRTASSASS
ncbi:hypothetical protein CUR178_05761 [Leishmania enriettii]|uniref:Uncharacterized protein n=1 Tax=Leishmania enriettii TaxID=5663 RepID=A0A836KYI8_LEIEN|nr:hypothetical protein CUR178_05761 [Leishmania enriettii]